MREMTRHHFCTGGGAPRAPQRGCRVGDPAGSPRAVADASPRTTRHGRRRCCFVLALFALVSPVSTQPARYDLRTQRAEFEQRGIGVNVALYVPHGAIRREVIGMADRAPTADELTRMVTLARNGMEAGGIGLSSGLYYTPGSYAKTEEVIALARVVGEMGGAYESHIRDEADYSVGLVSAVQEVIRIFEEGHLPGIVAHMKTLGPSSWGLSMAIVERIKQARDRGVEVYADQYPYEASGTGIVGALIPRWAEVGGRPELMKRI
jgi:N-acyl-D-amino-acid deacylase